MTSKGRCCAQVSLSGNIPYLLSSETPPSVLNPPFAINVSLLNVAVLSQRGGVLPDIDSSLDSLAVTAMILVSVNDFGGISR